MKTLKLAFFALALLFVASCGDDDDSMMVCTQADWVGTYTGTYRCEGDDESTDVTVTVTASGTENIIVEYVQMDSTLTVTTTYDPLPFSGCDFNNTAMAGGLSVSIQADRNGDEIALTETISDGTTTSTCRLTATRN